MNRILQQIGDFLGRKFALIKNEITTYTDSKVAEGVSESKSYTDTKAASTLTSAKSYTDTKVSDLVNGAPAALDTLKELADAYQANKDLIEALDSTVSGHVHANATSTSDGFMSKEDKAYVDSIGTYSEFVAAFNSAVGTGSVSYPEKS